MRAIVYLIEQPLDARNYDRFGIQNWINRGWSVEVWDITPWAYPRAWRHFIDSGYKFREFPGYIRIESKRQLEARYSGTVITHFIDLTGENYCSLRAKIFLKRRGITRVVCATGSIPLPDEEKKIGLLSKLCTAFLRGPINSIRWLNSAFLGKVAARLCRPGLTVVSGQASFPASEYGHPIIKAHNFDYDIYLKLRQSNEATAGGYIVFIDQDYCFHSDSLYYEVPFLMTPSKYFPAICNGLNTISQALAADVRIAGHPRATYHNKNKGYFQGFPIEYGRVGELIRDCKAVVCHDSTAIQLAVLFGKPLIFVTTNELIPSIGGKSTARVASVFGKSAINLDKNLRNVDWQKELLVDKRKYAEYKNKYIKLEGSPEIPFWDIVIDRIAGLEEVVRESRNS
jgi:hypothetical protein